METNCSEVDKSPRLRHSDLYICAAGCADVGIHGVRPVTYFCEENEGLGALLYFYLFSRYFPVFVR